MYLAVHTQEVGEALGLCCPWGTTGMGRCSWGGVAMGAALPPGELHSWGGVSSC